MCNDVSNACPIPLESRERGGGVERWEPEKSWGRRERGAETEGAVLGGAGNGDVRSPLLGHNSTESGVFEGSD